MKMSDKINKKETVRHRGEMSDGLFFEVKKLLVVVIGNFRKGFLGDF